MLSEQVFVRALPSLAGVHDEGAARVGWGDAHLAGRVVLVALERSVPFASAVTFMRASSPTCPVNKRCSAR